MQWIDKGTVEYLTKLVALNRTDIDNMNFLGHDPSIRINELKNNIKKDIKTIRHLQNLSKKQFKLEKENTLAIRFLKELDGKTLKPIQDRFK